MITTDAQKAKAREAEAEEPVEPVRIDESELTEKIDALLDEIDEILEENAEEFVAAYIQKGGE